MNIVAPEIVRRRRELGLSQVALASAAGVSLATIQNVEAGRANPSLSTMRNLLAPLSLDVGLEPVAVDWVVLAAHGLPLSALRDVSGVRPTPDSLAEHVRAAALELSANAGTDERKRESLAALLLAIRNHFPTYYRRCFGRSPLVGSFLPDDLTGRIIKLYRIARAAVAEYL